MGPWRPKSEAVVSISGFIQAKTLTMKIYHSFRVQPWRSSLDVHSCIEMSFFEVPRCTVEKSRVYLDSLLVFPISRLQRRISFFSSLIFLEKVAGDSPKAESQVTLLPLSQNI